MAILELTKKNLINLGLPKDLINKITQSSQEYFNLNFSIFVSNIEKKIYTELDYYTHTYTEQSKPKFPFNYLELIPEYYNIRLKQYLKSRRALLGKSFVEIAELETFKQFEIKAAEAVINHYSNLLKTRPESYEKHKAVIGKKAYKTWLEYIANKPQHQTNTIKKIEAPVFKPKLFKDLFNKPQIIDKCLNLLRETDKPCINEEKKYLRNKGAFIVWFNALEYKKVFKVEFCNDIERAETLNFNFEGLNISESLFRSRNKRATENYKAYFESEITAIKH